MERRSFLLGLLGAAVAGVAGTALTSSGAEARVLPANPVPGAPTEAPVSDALARPEDIEAAQPQDAQFFVVRRRRFVRRRVFVRRRRVFIVRRRRVFVRRRRVFFVRRRRF